MNSIEKINFDSPVCAKSIYLSIYIDIDTSFVCFWRRRCRRCRTIMRARRIKWNFILLLLFYVLHADVFTKYSIHLYLFIPILENPPPSPHYSGPSAFAVDLFPSVSFSLAIWVRASISGCRFSLFASFHFISMIKEREEKTLIWYWYFFC